MATDPIDTTPVDRAREAAEVAEQAAADARHAYFQAVAHLVEAHGATATARALELSRARVYQLVDKAHAET